MPESTSKPKFSNPFADVEVQPIHVAGEQVPSRVAVRVRDDNGAYAVASIMGKDYNLVPNQRVRDTVDNILSRTHATYGGFENLKTYFDGKRYADYFVSKNPIAEVSGGSGRQDLKLGVLAWNAYDGSRKIGFEIFALNPFCLNQYHERNRLGYFALRHDHEDANQFDVGDGIEQVERGVQNLIDFAPLIERVRKTPITPEIILQAKHTIVSFPQTKWGDVLDALYADPDKANAFGLYQALTSVASHRLAGLSSIDVGSEITEAFVGEKPSIALAR
jgi:hypothetical protein